MNLVITKSPSAAISVSEPSFTVVRIKESAGASVIVSKLTAPAEKSDNSEKSNKLCCSIKVEDSPYALVDLTGSSTSSESEIKRNVVNQEELLRIRTGTKLTDLSINAVQKMLKQQFPKLKRLISTLLQEKNSGMCKPTKNQLQILHSPNDHWIVASTVHCNDSEVCVLVYDSAYSTVDEKTSAIISNLFQSNNIIIKHSKKQNNGEDCGLFAIANATAISNGVDPCKIKLIEHLLRTHLMKCFDEGIMTLFLCTF